MNIFGWRLRTYVYTKLRFISKQIFDLYANKEKPSMLANKAKICKLC